MPTSRKISYATSANLFKTATFRGQPRYRWPLPPQCPIQLKAYAIDQECEQSLDAAAGFGTDGPWAKNAPAATAGLSLEPNAILTGYEQPRGIGGGIGRFGATFNIVPESWDDYSWIPYSFVDFLGVYPASSPSTSSQIPPNGPPRERFTNVVPVRMTYDYFVVDQANVISNVSPGSPNTANSVVDTAGNLVNCVYQLGDIQSINAAIFGVAWPFGNTRTGKLANFGGVNVAGTNQFQTLPCREDYTLMIQNALTGVWQSGTWDGVTTGITGNNLMAGSAATNGTGYYTATGLTSGAQYFFTTKGATGSSWISPTGYNYTAYFNCVDTTATYSASDPNWVPIIFPTSLCAAASFIMPAGKTAVKIFVPTIFNTVIGTNTTTYNLQIRASALPAGVGQYYSEDSKIIPYAGNIVARLSMRVLAK